MIVSPTFVGSAGIALTHALIVGPSRRLAPPEHVVGSL
jgi:hypothetical protein